ALVGVMRDALQATYRDPALLQEAAAMHLDVQPKTAVDILRILEEVLDTPPELAAKYRRIIQP
ncbi:MAG: hypothetical protein AB7I50_04810, partial [Vicinamibacterales bacterium]